MFDEADYKRWLAQKEAMKSPEDLGSALSFLKSGWTGLKQFGAGAAQPILESGFVPQSVREWSKQGQKERQQELQNLAYHNPISTAIGHTVGENLPLLVATRGLGAIPKGASLLQKAGIGLKSGAQTGALAGGLQYTNDDESRLLNTLLGAAVGSFLGVGVPFAGQAASMAGSSAKGLYEGLAKALGNEKLIAKDLTKGIATPRRALSNLEAAERLEMKLSPAQSSGHPGVKQREDRLGVKRETAEELIAHRNSEKASRENAVDSLLNLVGSPKSSVGKEAQQTAKAILEKDKAALQKKAAPLYEKADKDVISPNKLNAMLKRDGNIRREYEYVISDPTYEKHLKNAAPNSIKVLHKVQERLSDRAATLLKQDEKHAAKELIKARKNLLEAMDEISPSYQKARAIYAKEAPGIRALEESPIGTIANFESKQLKNIPNTIFDPKETDISVLNELRNRMYKENPEAWNNMVRRALENRITARTAPGKEKDIASKFYKNVLSSDADYNQFNAALKGNKEAQKMLSDMRQAFQYISEHPTPPGTVGLEQKWKQKLKNGVYDKAAVHLITSGKWADYLRKELANASKKQKADLILPVLQEMTRKGTPIIGANKATETKGR